MFYFLEKRVSGTNNSNFFKKHQIFHLYFQRLVAIFLKAS